MFAMVASTLIGILDVRFPPKADSSLQDQYTRALGLMYWMSLVSVNSCTGR